MSSTHRTARCGPACRVVWEGNPGAKPGAPIPISVSLTLCGTGLAGGEWSRSEAMIEQRVVQAGVKVTVYDLPS